MKILVVDDDRCGILEEHLPSIFKKGFSTKVKGHGYGLASCATSMEKMGDRISIKSEGKNKGAQVIIIVPTRQEPHT